MNDVSTCVFSDIRYTLIEMGERHADDISADVFHLMADSLLYPPASNGEWGGWTAKDIADFERHYPECPGCEFDN